MVDEPIRVLISDVPGAEPTANFTIDERIASRFRLAPIAAHNVPAARDDLTGRAHRSPLALAIHDREFHAPHGPSTGKDAIARMIRVIERGQQRARLGEAV